MPLLYLVLSLVIVAVAARLINNNHAPMPENTRSILNIVLALLVVGMALWLINTYVPMAGSIKTILNILVVVVNCVRVRQAVGVWSEVVKIWTNLTKHRISS